MNNSLKTVSFLLIINFYGCSAIQKNTFFKKDKKEHSWTFVNGRTYSPYYVFDGYTEPERPYSFSCDSIVSLEIEFCIRSKCIASGPLLIPFVPGKNVLFNDEQNPCSFEININTDLTINLDSLKRHIHFFVNYNNVEINAVFGVDKTFQIKDESLKKKLHKKYQRIIKAGFIYQIKGTLNLDTDLTNMIFVQFDNEFNRQLKSDFKPIKFYKKMRLHYFPFILPTH